MKRCRTCEVEKEVSAFHKCSSRHDKLQANCKTCAKQLRTRHRKAAWANELARARIYNAEWRRRNKEKSQGYQRAYKTRVANTLPAKNKAWYDLDKANPHSKRARWVVANIERVREAKIRNKAKRRGASGHHTLQEWQHLKAAHSYTCLRCGKSEPEIKLTRDHVIPLVKGGTDDIANIQPLCMPCNQKKLAKHIDYRTSCGGSLPPLTILPPRICGTPFAPVALPA